MDQGSLRSSWVRPLEGVVTALKQVAITLKYKVEVTNVRGRDRKYEKSGLQNRMSQAQQTLETVLKLTKFVSKTVNKSRAGRDDDRVYSERRLANDDSQSILKNLRV